MTEQARWYVIHTYSGYETLVKDSLEKLRENNNLQERIVDIMIPTDETVEEKASGKKKIVVRKKLPCYVFLKMVYSNDLWYLITNTRGVTGFVGPQGRPLPLSKEEVARMGLETRLQLDEIDFVVGDTVKIINGPLESQSGKILEINTETQKAKVNVEMFGRPMDVEVDLVQVKKIVAEENSD